ncbi:hypothetical protein R3P38DRAFT_1055051 [Favolaschia claudopus]|uniref:F-box domain-containing protein n=1 Tax=Favolaschia claudopus TaxID=2862362 RepID=A0AAW0BH49_9AGAR
MAQDLPPEIVDLIVEQFQLTTRDDKRCIARMGLVCKDWLPSSRYRFFSDVDLNDHTSGPFLAVLENTPFPVTNYIRSLGLSFAGREDTFEIEAMLRTLGHLPLVKTLRITLNDQVLAGNASLITELFPGTTHLVFRGIPLALNSILSTAMGFHSLKSLKLDWVDVVAASESDEPLSSYHLSPKLESIELDPLDPGNGNTFFGAILGLHPVPVISSLSIREVNPSEPSSLGRYLLHLGSALRHLRMESPSRDAPRDHLTALRYCTGLQQLDLVYHHGSDVGTSVSRAISIIESRTLTVITVLHKSSVDTSPSEWQAVDEQLADSQFAKLQVFRLGSIEPGLVRTAFENMPMASRRGILRSVKI